MQETLETLALPEGYQFLCALHYPKRFAYLFFLFYICFYLLFCFIWTFVRHSLFTGVPGPALYWVFASPLLIIDMLRALIQRSISHLFGYTISFGRNSPVFQPETYTAEPGQFQKRGHVLFIALAPLGIFLLLWFPLFIGLPGVLSDIFALFLFVSIARTTGDLYFIWRLLRMPEGTVLYNVNSKEKLFFKPRS